MKKIFINIIAVLSLLTLTNCQEKDAAFGEISAPTDLVVTSVIQGQSQTAPNGDGTGFVRFNATAKNAISYSYVFSDGITKNAPSGALNYPFQQPGIVNYTVTVTASGKGGLSTVKSFQLQVFFNYTDAVAIQALTGGSQKNWYWAASEPGHLGVGQNDSNSAQNYFANYYQAAPWEKAASTDSSCLYQNILTFSLVGTQLKYQLDNNGATFFNKDYKSVAGGTANDDRCYTYSTVGLKNVSLSPANTVVGTTHSTGTMLNFSNGGFMGYYIGQNSYEILSISATRMVVRAVSGSDPNLAWYHIFTSVQPTQDATDYTNLVWADEFNVDGAPDPTKRSYDIGNNNGWGNGEVQYYTNSPSNSIVSGGSLKIITKSESISGYNYSSARLKTQGKKDFTYGKIECRAKLPVGSGTWPAIWMLGSNINTVSWPACGEIDIMEHKGNFPDIIYGSLHYPGRFGGNANTNTTNANNSVSANFHNYKVIWSPSSIRIFIDNNLFHTVINSGSLPFNNNFFLILNNAMGGTFGGNIAPGFVQSTMEVDYIRLYQ